MKNFKQLDFLEKQADTALVLLAEGKTDDVVTIIKALKPMIVEEKRKVAGEGTDTYCYRCVGCSLGCYGEFLFEPSGDNLKYCRLEGSMEADYQQVTVKGSTKKT